MKLIEAQAQLALIEMFPRTIINGYAITHRLGPSVVRSLSVSFGVERRYKQGYVPGVTILKDNQPMVALSLVGTMKYIAASGHIHFESWRTHES